MSWDKHIKSLVVCNKQKLDGLHRILCNFALDVAVSYGMLINVRPKHWSAYACKYIQGYSVTTCDVPVHAELGFKSLKSRRYFHKLKWYHKVVCMNNKRLYI